ncbi:MAG: hypothetical protein M3Z64_06175, partial [Verrucomicrobiota bacterium]|nr:hypothetical protein [Verrucomicrobiota bacterium]
AKNDAAKAELIHDFATHEPPGWRLPAGVPLSDYGEAWANDILPIAREAHTRLDLRNIAPRTDESGVVVAAGVAAEKPVPDHISYRDWSARIVRQELPKAGWRLADLLEQALK